MKDFINYLSKLLVCVLISFANLSVKAELEKIDETHYRMCVMDCSVLWTLYAMMLTK